MHTTSPRLVFSGLLLSATSVLGAGLHYADATVTAAGGGLVLAVLAAGVLRALPGPHPHPYPHPSPSASTSPSPPARPKASPSKEPIVTLSVVEKEESFDDDAFTVVPRRPEPAHVAEAPRASHAEAALWGPPAGWRPTAASEPLAPVPPGPPRRYAPGFEPKGAAAGAAAPPATPPPARPEWARPAPAAAEPAPRYSALGGATTRGMCSKCGTHLTLSARRPLRATCPVCGHTKLLT